LPFQRNSKTVTQVDAKPDRIFDDDMFTLDRATLNVFDIWDFPVITVRNDAIRAGYATQWAHEMDVLVAHGRPFAMLYVEAPGDKPHKDFGQRGQSLKQNKEALARVCAMLLTVEPDDDWREEARVRGRGACKALGIPHRAAGTLAEALDLVSYRRRCLPGAVVWGGILREGFHERSMVKRTRYVTGA
jgi:hypothetical protein